jgi:hypothetical protein
MWGLMLGREQVLRQLQRGILEELRQLQEPGSNGHVCWKNFKPLLEVSLKSVRSHIMQSLMLADRGR